MKRILLAMALMPLISGPGFAEFDAGRDAFIRGDFAAAYREFLPTATAGDAKSSIGLGLLHARGLGVPKNMVQAHSWFDRAVRNSKGGNSVVRILAESNRDFLAKRMSTEQLAEAKFNNAATSASKDAVVSLVGGFAPVYRGRSGKRPAAARTRSTDTRRRHQTLSNGRIVRIQLTALREANDKAVLSAWSRLSRQHVQLNGLKPTVSEVDLGSKGVFRRLRAGPFESRAAAHSTCQALQAANQKCFVVKN
jgi:hypothetical protein